MKFVALLLILLSLVAARDSAAADKLRIGYSGATITNSMLWITHEGRLFEKNGIVAEVLYLQTTLGQTAMIAGEIQMCVYSASLLTPARLQGADVVMLLSFLHKPIYRLVVRPEIRAFADLRGKRIGVTRFGTVSDWTTRLLLARLGFDAEKDVTLIQTGDVPIMVNSLASGRTIDAAMMQPPYDKKLAAQGLRILLNMQEMDIVLQQTGLNTTQKFIARNPDITRRAVKSLIDGIHFMRNNPAVAKRAIGRHMQIKDERELEDSYQLLRSFIQPKPYPNLDGFKPIFEEAGKRLPAAKTANAKDFVDTRFIEELDKSGYIDGLYK